VKYWEIIADHLSKAGWAWGCVSAVNSHGRIIFVADAHRGGGKRFVVRALSPAMTADLNFFQNVEKSVCAKAFGHNNRIKIAPNQVCPRITRHGRQARIGTNEFSSDTALFALIGVIRRHSLWRTSCGESRDKNRTGNEQNRRFHCSSCGILSNLCRIISVN
jgi:hypothetical protein